MTTVQRFEAKDVEPSISGKTAMLLIDTVKDGRVTVWMKRRTFVALFARMRLALDQDRAANPGSKPNTFR
jgi:hypothetical protein